MKAVTLVTIVTLITVVGFGVTTTTTLALASGENIGSCHKALGDSGIASCGPGNFQIPPSDGDATGHTGFCHSQFEQLGLSQHDQVIACSPA